EGGGGGGRRGGARRGRAALAAGGRHPDGGGGARRRGADARAVGRVRQGTAAGWQADRVGPGDEASLWRHGGGGRTLELLVEYAKVRRQFGKPIGTFQAIKHRCADMAVRAEVARAMVTYAAGALAEGEPDVARHGAMAKTLAGGAAIANATDNIQNHGGMGYTWESDAHLYLKRARLLEHCFGTRTAHLDALAAPWRAAPGGPAP